MTYPGLQLVTGKLKLGKLPGLGGLAAGSIAGRGSPKKRKRNKGSKMAKPSWAQCKTFGKMTAVKRHGLPNTAFGIPETRSYPMPDPKHAANAKARAEQMLTKRKLSRKDYNRIIRKADRVLRACPSSLGRTSPTPAKKKSRGRWTSSQQKRYKGLSASCARQKKCSKKSGKAKMNCTRGCKSLASRKVNKGR